MKKVKSGYNRMTRSGIIRNMADKLDLAHALNTY